MAQEKIQSEQQHKVLLLNQIPLHFGETARKQFEELTHVQGELLVQAQEANKQWLDRVQTETHLGAEFVSNLTSARSIAEAMAAFEYWGVRRLEMMTEDAKHLASNASKLMQTSAGMFADRVSKSADASK